MDRFGGWLVELPRVVVDQVILWNNVFVDVGGKELRVDRFVGWLNCQVLLLHRQS